MAVASAAGKVVLLSSRAELTCSSGSGSSSVPAGACESLGFSSAIRNEPSVSPRYCSSSWRSLKCLRIGDGSGSSDHRASAGRKSFLGRLDGGGDGFASSSCISLSSRNLGSRNDSRVEGVGSSPMSSRRRALSNGEPSLSDSVSIFEVADPRAQAQGNNPRAGAVDLNQALEVLWQDVLYLDWRARQDVLAIKSAHDKVVEVLNPLAREQNSVKVRREQLAELQEELARAHTQVHLSEARVEHSLKKLSEIEGFINDKLLYSVSTDGTKMMQLKSATSVVADESKGSVADSSLPLTDRNAQRRLNVSGPVLPYPNKLKNFWYPVAFSRDINVDTLIPIESFEEPWVLFRGPEGRAGCVRDECAHRACPLSLGKVVDGKIQCPYHGWEYNTGGECKKMPSTRSLQASIRSLPCIEQDGMIWIWPGDETPGTVLPSLNPPADFTIHAEIVLELPVEHGLLMENLLDLAHAPFTHTSTFAKGWSVPNFVRFRTPAAALRGNWDPYPIDMEFQPPCMVLSTIGLVKPGQLDGSSAQACSKHLHQLHVCLPSTRGKTRLLYRMALDFAYWAKYVPYITKLWEYLANQVLNEDLRLVEGQQDRMQRGANVWETPVAYDKLGVRYRRWRNAVEAGGSRIPFESGSSEGS